MSLINLSRGLADTFDRLPNGQINFDGLDLKLLMVETRAGARYIGIVSRGKDEKYVLYTGTPIERDFLGKTIEGVSVDGYVLPLERANFEVVKNNDPTSSYTYLLSTKDIGPFDLVRDTTLFDRVLA
jgi:hypothetical protein